MTRPSKSTVLGEVEKRIDDDAIIHAVIPTGNSDDDWFFLVLFEESHRDAGGDAPADATLLKERYFQYPKEGSDHQITFLQNGINRRRTGDLTNRLVKAYARADNVRGTTDLDPLWIDTDDSENP